MGKTYSKDEVVIAQTASGGSNGATSSDRHEHTILLSFLVGVVGIFVIILFIKICAKYGQSIIQREVRHEMVRRIQARLSGRGNRKQQEGEAGDNSQANIV